MENVFSYFMAIGSGLATGIVIILMPTFIIFNKIRGGKKDVRNAWTK